VSSNARDIQQYRQEIAERAVLLTRYRRVRDMSESLCAPLLTEDCCMQTMPDVSPPKWHLAHVSWFFETFVLKPFLPDYDEVNPQFAVLFNSYYEGAGAMHPRAQRGLLSRPPLEEVYRYRRHIDARMIALIESAPEVQWRDIAFRTVLGIHHEQQHQELLLTDIKHIFASQPLRPIYKEAARETSSPLPALEWREFPGGLYEIGHGGEGFCYDNETPRHRVYIEPFRLASRPVTNGEYMTFMAAGGYKRAEYWLSEAWTTLRERNWQAPLYWERGDDGWRHMTLSGLRPVDEHEPVCHVSFYEADAYARWAGRRLPSEQEWEIAARDVAVAGNLQESGRFHPAPACNAGMTQIYGDVWEWTGSPYVAYPGFRPLAGTLGEYNGKFMCNQMVLRGGSCVTPADHIRASYRNFFHPGDRWQFSGIRLADDKG
jgi:ergothioneine biosynthesis protein EgtB